MKDFKVGEESIDSLEDKFIAECLENYSYIHELWLNFSKFEERILDQASKHLEDIFFENKIIE